MRLLALIAVFVCSTLFADVCLAQATADQKACVQGEVDKQKGKQIDRAGAQKVLDQCKVKLSDKEKAAVGDAPHCWLCVFVNNCGSCVKNGQCKDSKQCFGS